MFRLLKGLAVLFVCLIALGAAAGWYVKPEKQLDLAYEEVRWSGKVKEMIVARKLEVDMNGDDLNQLVKKALARKPAVSEQFVLTGAEASQHEDKLYIDVTGLLRDEWPVGARLTFRLSWADPYLTAEHIRTDIKQATIPQSWFRLQPIRINVVEQLPPLVGIRAVAFGDSSIAIGLKLR